MCPDPQPAAQRISAAEIRRQVWRSLVSMVRVYTSLESLSLQESIERTECVIHSAAVEIGSRRLKLLFAPENGRGEWSLSGQAGEFTISESGLLLVDREEKELDIAALEWLQKLSSRHGRSSESGRLSENIRPHQEPPPEYEPDYDR